MQPTLLSMFSSVRAGEVLAQEKCWHRGRRAVDVRRERRRAAGHQGRPQLQDCCHVQPSMMSMYTVAA